MGEIVGHRFDREQVGFAAELFGRLDHLLQAARAVQHQFVRQHHRERLVADDVARAPDRVAEAERRLLAGETGGAGFGLVARQNVLLGLLVAARGQRGVEFEHPVEMILDHALVAAGDEDEMLDARLLGLVDDILDQRLVDDGQHFLRHRLGGGQEAGAETGDREDGFADFHGMSEALEMRNFATGKMLRLHVGSQFASANKGGCMMRIVSPPLALAGGDDEIPPLLSCWKP